MEFLVSFTTMRSMGNFDDNKKPAPPRVLEALQRDQRQIDIGWEETMNGRRFQDIWKEQCEAARGIREQHGVVSALDYLVGEKLMNYAQMAVARPEFARELPRFVGEIRTIFGPEEIKLYLDHLERMDAQEEEALATEPADDDVVIDTPEQRAASTARLARLKELLTANVLGTG